MTIKRVRKFSLVGFNNVFSQEKVGCNSFQREISQKLDINNKKHHILIYQIYDI